MHRERRHCGSKGGTRFDDFAESSEAMRAVFEAATKLRGSNDAVLIRGEVGVGKERLARAIHAASEHPEGPFIVVDCSALSTDRIPGALTADTEGAPHVGPPPMERSLHASEKGTLFLDEVADLSSDVQRMLLDLPERRLASLGIRVISATTRDLQAEVDQGRFDGALLRRLSDVTLHIPPLRERPEDIASIVNAVLSRHDAERKLELTPDALEFVRAQHWHGNVRELERTIEQSVLLADGDALGLSDLITTGAQASEAFEGRRDVAALLALVAEHELPLRSIEDLYIEQILERTRGNKARAARILGVNRTTLYRRGS